MKKLSREDWEASCRDEGITKAGYDMYIELAQTLEDQVLALEANGKSEADILEILRVLPRMIAFRHKKAKSTRKLALK